MSGSLSIYHFIKVEASKIVSKDIQHIFFICSHLIMQLVPFLKLSGCNGTRVKSDITVTSNAPSCLYLLPKICFLTAQQPPCCFCAWLVCFKSGSLTHIYLESSSSRCLHSTLWALGLELRFHYSEKLCPSKLYKSASCLSTSA